MTELNQIISDNLLVVALLLVILILFGKKKEKQARIPNIDFDADLDSATAEHDPKAKPTKQPSFLTRWPEAWMIPLILLIAGSISYACVLFWPDAIFLGPEQIQKLLYKTVVSFMAYLMFFLLDKINFNNAWQRYTEDVEEINNSNEITQWQKRLTYFWRLSVFVLVFALA